MQFSGNFEQILGSGPPRVKTLLGPPWPKSWICAWACHWWIQGALGAGGQGPPCPPRCFQNHAVLRQKRENSYFGQILGSGPLWGQNSAGPLTKILDPLAPEVESSWKQRTRHDSSALSATHYAGCSLNLVFHKEGRWCSVQCLMYNNNWGFAPTLIFCRNLYTPAQFFDTMHDFRFCLTPMEKHRVQPNR